MGHQGIRIACFLLSIAVLGAPRAAHAQAGDQYIRSFYTKQLDQALNAKPNEGLSTQLQQLRTKIQDKNLPVTSLLPEADKLLELVRTSQKGTRAATPGMRKQATDATERFMKWLDDLVKVNSATEGKIRNEIAKLQLFESANDKGQVDPNAMKQLKEFLRTVLPADDVAKLEQPGILEQLAQAAVNAEDNPPALYAAAGGGGGGRGLAARSGGAGGNGADPNAPASASAAGGAPKDANASKGLVDMGPLEKPNTNKSLNPNLGALGDTPPINQAPPDLGGGDSGYPDSMAAPSNASNGSGGGSSGSPTTSGAGGGGQKQASAPGNNVVSRNSGSSAGGSPQGTPSAANQRNGINQHTGMTGPVGYGVVVPQNANQMQTRNATPQATAQRTNTIKSNVPSRNYSQEDVARAYRDRDYWKGIAQTSPAGAIRQNAENMLAFSEGIISKATPQNRALAESDIKKNSVPGPGGMQCYQYGTPNPKSPYGCDINPKAAEQLIFEAQQRGLHFDAIAKNVFSEKTAPNFARDYLNLPNPDVIKCVNNEVDVPDSLRRMGALYDFKALPKSASSASINDLNLVRFGISSLTAQGQLVASTYFKCRAIINGKPCGGSNSLGCDSLVSQFYSVSSRTQIAKGPIKHPYFPFITRDPLQECSGACQARSLLPYLFGKVLAEAQKCETPSAIAMDSLLRGSGCIGNNDLSRVQYNEQFRTDTLSVSAKIVDRSNLSSQTNRDDFLNKRKLLDLSYSFSGKMSEDLAPVCKANDGALRYFSNLLMNPRKSQDKTPSLQYCRKGADADSHIGNGSH